MDRALFRCAQHFSAASPSGHGQRFFTALSSRSYNFVTVDLSCFRMEPSPMVREARRKVANQLELACRETGFFYATGHGYSAEDIFKAMREYFALSVEKKSRIPITPGGFTRGYIGIGAESGGSSFEVKEGFSYGYNWPLDCAPDNPLQGPNVLPDPSLLPHGWDVVLNRHFDSMVMVSDLVCRALSLSLDLEEAGLGTHCRQGASISLMRLFRYLPYSILASGSQWAQAETKQLIGSSPHTDWGFLTLICQDQVSGLQLCIDSTQQAQQSGFTQSNESSWLEIPTVPGTILVNLGDYLSLLTEGRYLSPLHRVVNRDQERLSTVFFYYPDYDSRIPILYSAGKKEGLGIGSSANATKADSEWGARDVSCRISLLAQQRVSSPTTVTAESVSQGVCVGKSVEALAEISFGNYIKEKWDQVYRH
eukprot:gb/GEZN01008024.1/.p1 GENE.gb/GEZN01008024.1/~~gb/GEZN01008024.1/.p1  ORF type:complete len:423 (-),score=44.63 gb/GEZN01008024.1/:125-1393(-)